MQRDIVLSGVTDAQILCFSGVFCCLKVWAREGTFFVFPNFRCSFPTLVEKECKTLWKKSGKVSVLTGIRKEVISGGNGRRAIRRGEGEAAAGLFVCGGRAEKKDSKLQYQIGHYGK